MPGRAHLLAAVAVLACIAAPGASPRAQQALDGLPILFQTDRGGTSDIYAMTSRGARQTAVVAGPANEEDAAWAPSGGAIAFSSDRDGSWQIYLRDASGEVRQLTDGNHSNIDPVWSPDGKRIAFETNRNDNWDVYVMNVTGSGVANVSKSRFDELDPAWEPRGASIAFTRIERRRADIFSADVATGDVRRITSTPEPEFEPAYSPRGTALAFSRVVARNPDVYVLDLKSQRTRRLTRAATFDGDPTWTSDSRAVLFSSGRVDGDLEIYLVPATGGTPRNLTNRHDANDSEADWRPGVPFALAQRLARGAQAALTHGPAFQCGAPVSTESIPPYTVLHGGSGINRLCGGAGRQWLRSYASEDKLAGGDGVDRLEAGAHGDVVIKAHDGFGDFLYGGTITVVAADKLTVVTHVDTNLNDTAWVDKNLDAYSPVSTYGIDKPNF